jgi:hypothetical protein
LPSAFLCTVTALIWSTLEVKSKLGTKLKEYGERLKEEPAKKAARKKSA